MNREKMGGENLRDGSIEVAFELWPEQETKQAPTEISTVIIESDLGINY